MRLEGGSRGYDSEMQMFRDQEREPSMKKLKFLRWLAEQGRLEHPVFGAPVGEYIHLVSIESVPAVIQSPKQVEPKIPAPSKTDEFEEWKLTTDDFHFTQIPEQTKNLLTEFYAGRLAVSLDQLRTQPLEGFNLIVTQWAAFSNFRSLQRMGRSDLASRIRDNIQNAAVVHTARKG